MREEEKALFNNRSREALEKFPQSFGRRVISRRGSLEVIRGRDSGTRHTWRLAWRPKSLARLRRLPRDGDFAPGDRVLPKIFGGRRTVGERTGQRPSKPNAVPPTVLFDSSREGIRRQANPRVAGRLSHGCPGEARGFPRILR